MEQRGSEGLSPASPVRRSIASTLWRSPLQQRTPRRGAAFLDAVGACYQRLTAQGIDPGAYDIRAMAADGEDLRRALGIDTWGIISIGSASRIALEMAREYPRHIRELVLDSPEVPQVDPFTEGIIGTRAAIGQMAAACRERTRGAYIDIPDLEQAFEAAGTALDQHPLSPHGGRPVRRQSSRWSSSTVDVLRGIRTLLAGEGDAVKALPRRSSTRRSTARRPCSPYITDGLATNRPIASDTGRRATRRTRSRSAPISPCCAVTSHRSSIAARSPHSLPAMPTSSPYSRGRRGWTHAAIGRCPPRTRACCPRVERRADADPARALRPVRRARGRPAGRDRALALGRDRPGGRTKHSGRRLLPGSPHALAGGPDVAA